MKTLLHIGRHKTGTSSLQKFLHMNRDELRKRGFLYPDAGMKGGGVAHHGLMRCFLNEPAHAVPRHDNGPLEAIIGEMEEEKRDFRGQVIVSSEGFQNVDPGEVAKVFTPHDTAVIVYLREQAGYCISAYQQRVHAGDPSLSLAEYAQRFNTDYGKFLNKWTGAFGMNHLIVRPYSRQLLRQGDIIADFCAVAGIDMEGLATPGRDQNPSIGGPLLELRRLLNKASTNLCHTRPIFRIMGELARRHPVYQLRPVLSEQVVHRFVTRFGASNRGVSRACFGREDALDISAPAPAGARAPSAGELHETLHAIFRLNWRAGAVSAYVLSKLMDYLEKGQPPADFIPVQITDGSELPRKIGHITIARIETVLASGFLPDLNTYAFPEPGAPDSP